MKLNSLYTVFRNLEFCSELGDINSMELKGQKIAFMNPMMFIYLIKNDAFREVIFDFDRIYCDSIFLKRIFEVVNKEKVIRIPGPRIFKKRTEIVSRYVSLIGGIDEKGLSTLKHNLGLVDPLLLCPPLRTHENFDYNIYAKQINSRKIHDIYVGLGAPKQEYFIAHLGKFVSKEINFFGVGAAFDFYQSGSTMPKLQILMSKIGIEWLYRLFQKPLKMSSRLFKLVIWAPVIIIGSLLYRFKYER